MKGDWGRSSSIRKIKRIASELRAKRVIEHGEAVTLRWVSNVCGDERLE